MFPSCQKDNHATKWEESINSNDIAAPITARQVNIRFRLLRHLRGSDGNRRKRPTDENVQPGLPLELRLFSGSCCVSPSHVVLAAMAATKFKVCYNGQTNAGGGRYLRVGGAIAEVMKPDMVK